MRSKRERIVVMRSMFSPALRASSCQVRELRLVGCDISDESLQCCRLHKPGGYDERKQADLAACAEGALKDRRYLALKSEFARAETERSAMRRAAGAVEGSWLRRSSPWKLRLGGSGMFQS